MRFKITNKVIDFKVSKYKIKSKCFNTKNVIEQTESVITNLLWYSSLVLTKEIVLKE